MSKKKDEFRHQFDHLNTLIINKQREIENLELQLSLTHENASVYTHVPAKIQLEIKDLENRIQQANNELPNLEKEKERLQNLIDGLVDADGPSMYPVAKETEINYAAILFGGLFILTILAAIWLDIQVFYPMFSAPVVYQQMLDPNFHHLGDNTYSEAYINSISGDKIHNLASEGLIYTTTFDILSIRRAAQVSESEAIKKVEMSLYVNALKPRESAPVVVGINGNMVTYLNVMVTREEFRRTPITFLLDVPLHEGQNEIEIMTGKDVVQSDPGFDEYEDFEFDSLTIQVTFDTIRLNLLPFLGVIAVELALLGILFALVQRSLD